MPLTKLSLGCSAFGGVFTPMSDAECLAIFRRAFAEGITLLDTAPWYQASERVVGRCLRALAASGEVPRAAYELNTKVGRYPSGKMFDFSAARTTASVEQSLAHLQTDYIDTIQVHDVEFGDEDVILRETLPALDALRRAGKVRAIGVTGYDLVALRRVVARSAVKIDAVLTYCRFTLNDRALLERPIATTPADAAAVDGDATKAAAAFDDDDDDFVSFLEARGVRLINASAIGMGLLCHNEPPAWHPASTGLRARAAAAAAHAAARGCDLARLALGFVLRHPRVPTTLVSVTTMAQMEANLDVMHHGLRAEETAVLEEVLQQFFPQSENWVGVEKARMEAKEARKQKEAAAAAAAAAGGKEKEAEEAVARERQQQQGTAGAAPASASTPEQKGDSGEVEGKTSSPVAAAAGAARAAAVLSAH